MSHKLILIEYNFVSILALLVGINPELIDSKSSYCYANSYGSSDCSVETNFIQTSQNSRNSIQKLKPGDYGGPVNLQNLSKEENVKKEELFNTYGYNQYVSNLISVHRSLPDYRDEW
jgi:hypothetical protein